MIDKNKYHYEPMTCPVCGKFYFAEPSQAVILTEDYVQCSECGWIYDWGQFKDPNLKDGLNKKSLNECRMEYVKNLDLNPDYNYQGATYKEKPHDCPVCGKYRFPDVSSSDICPFCGWEDDGVMEREPNAWAGNANDLCLNDYRKRYKDLMKQDPQYTFMKKGLPKVWGKG